MRQPGRVAAAAPWAAGVVLLLLALAVVLAGLTGPAEPAARETVTLPPVTATRAPQGSVGQAPSVPPLVPTLREESPLWRWVLTGVLVLFLLAVAWLAHRLRRLVHEADPDPLPPARHGARASAPPDLVTAADDGLALLAGTGTADVSDAVIACWVRLEQAAADTGVPRHPASTPSEFTAGLIVAGIGREAEVRELLGLYHLARFGSRPLPDGAAGRAIACLAAIRASATHPAATP